MPSEPWFFQNQRSKAWRGIGIDFGTQVAADLGVKPITVETSWANCMPALQASQIDAMFVLDPTPDRRGAVDFPDAPLFYYAAGALVRQYEGARTWKDLDRPETRVAVTLSTSMDRKVTEELKAASVSRYTTNEAAVDAFGARKVDVVVLFHPALVVQRTRVGVGKVILPSPVVPIATSVGVRRDAGPDFRTWLGERLESYYREGRPQTYFAAYLRERGVDPDAFPGLLKESWA